MATGLTFWFSLAAVAQIPHDRTVLFDNAPAGSTYWFSEGSAVAPSTLEVQGGRLPVARDRFSSPGNSLRLRWTSAPGGDWRAVIKVPARYGREFDFNGDTLSLRIYSDREIPAAASPRLHVTDAAGNGTPTIDLLRGLDRLPAGRWVRVDAPFASFTNLFGWTEDVKFNPRKLANVILVQGLDSGSEHILHVDDIRVIHAEAPPDYTPPPAPQRLRATAAELHVDLAWDLVPEPDALFYRIHRSLEGGPFLPIASQQSRFGRYADFLGAVGKTARYRITAVDGADNESPASHFVEATTRALSDAELLDMVQAACFRYYWEAAHPEAGMALEILPGDPNLVATGASGFGVLAILAATDRGFVPRTESAARLVRILRFLARADRFHGVWPHFLDGRSGRTIARFGPYDNGGDLVETAFLMQGLLAARQYFDLATADEQEIRDTVTRLWREVEWDWYRRSPDSEVLYWHWSPDAGFRIAHPLIGWNETMIVYLLAIASPTHPIPARLYHSGWAGTSELAVRYRQGWSRTTEGDHYTNGNSYHGIRLDVGSGTGGELFFTQFSFLGFDPRGRRDRYANYAVNNRAIALINRAHCIANPRGHIGYGPDCWGLSAGINAGGGKAMPRDDNGTINVMAALGSMPWTPQESFAALKHFYRNLGSKIWGIYGFHDGFNETQQWFEEVYMGLNQAPIFVMIENHRTALLWNKFMANPEIPRALESIGFRPDPGR